MRDARFQFALARQLDQQFGVGAAHFGLVLGGAAKAYTDHFEAFNQEVVGARGRWSAAEKTQHQNAPAEGKTAQRLVEYGRADRVVADIDTVMRAGDLLDPVAKSLSVVDRKVGPFLKANLAFLARRSGRDDLGTKELGDLDRGDADAAGGAVDQHPVAGLHAAALDKRVVGGVMRAAKHRRFLDAHPGRNR